GYSLANSGVSYNASAGTAVFGGDHTTFNTLKNLNLRWYDSLTLECFVKSAPAATIQMIMEISTNAALTQGTSYLSAHANPGPADSVFTTAIYPYFGGKSYKYNQDLSVAGKALTDGKWHHLAFVIDSAQSGADRAKLYLDRAPQSVPSANISDLAVDFFNATLYIGSRGNSEYKFTGEMDDVRISGAALTTDQFLQVRSSPQGTLLSLR
ncbi:MAG: LamG-like jellyroll fold domain-containing protein, partial [Kiritimatiellia bacterium]|nr:LamG-like jellyroll fold domain-containing protein [Kiritimatiellia bacterium]